MALGLTLVMLGAGRSGGAPAIQAEGTNPRQAADEAELAAPATTYYVRTDGGSPAQCTGLVDAPYPGSGTNRPCAWDHPFRALPPGGPPRIAGGDTLIIGPGSYMMGYGAPGAADNPDACHSDYPWGCHMSPIPSGPDAAHPTRILGAGWDRGCPNPAELWGAERADRILDLTAASNVELACLEITDHSGCVEFHTGDLTCERDSYPFGDWAARGIYAEDSANVYLHDLNIHGLASSGVHAGRLTDWTVEDVRIAGNGLAGWDGDLWEGGSSNSGTLLFRRWTVEWNGCGETWPGEEPAGCWGQDAGGYGDGVGTGATQGHWIIEDSAFLHNTSDGLDLLYVQPGGQIEIRRTIAEGNDGQQIKTRGPARIENSILVGNCGFFDGQPFTFNAEPICRAGGTALITYLRAGDQVTVTNNTLTSEGDCVVVAECDGGCDGSETVRLRNNIIVGQTDFLQPWENTCLIYEETFPSDPFDVDFSVIADVKDDLCPGPHDTCGVAPGVVSTAIDAFDAHLLADSAAIDAGTASGAPADDFDGLARDAVPDIGAYEWRAPTLVPFPDWAFEARLAGASFDPEMADAEIDAVLQQAAAEGVSVLLADAPTGWSYTAWADDAEFNQVLALMRDRVFPRARARGLKVVWYLTALELVCEGCAQTGRDPATEHPEWLQIDRFGDELEFSGVQDTFWLEQDDVDVWLSPESPYRDFYIDRINDIAASGADGLWVDVAYLLNDIGQFEDLWPSYDPYSRAAFQAAFGHATIPSKNWNNLPWRQFVRWRMTSITRFVEDVFAAARAVDPDMVFFAENFGMDSNFVTQYAQDPLEFSPNPDVATAHELEPVDQDNAGMANATLKQWRDYALMVKFGVASNKGKPAWILTYAGAVDDSLREAGVHLAEGANFYEAKGPEMVDDSTGSRPTVFPWLAANAGLAYHSASMADVAVWYSPRTRDFIDGENAGDSKFDYADTTYIKEYRNRAQDLLKAQVPFDIVTGRSSLAELENYAWLVLPDAACLSDAEARLLRDYAAAGGKLAVTGSTGAMDEWCQPRAANALAGVATYGFDQVTSDVLTTDLPAADRPRVHIGARVGADDAGPFVILPLANFDRTQTYTAIGLTVRLPDNFTPTSASWNAPDAAGGTLDYTSSSGRLSVTLPALDTAAAVVVRGTDSGPPPADACLTDVNTNGIIDVADMVATASKLGCIYYLPFLANSWHQDW